MTQFQLFFARVSIFIFSLILLGCHANRRAVFREYEIAGKGVASVLIDAKQRGIIATSVPRDEPRDGSKAPLRRSVVVCAEPSPDLYTVASTELLASVKNSAYSTELSSALVETGRQLGARNTTIQLLRDGLYRQCEAYMNGVISSAEYKNMVNRYVDGMVTLLAIERITSNKLHEKSSKEQQPQPNKDSSQRDISSNPEFIDHPFSPSQIGAVTDITIAFLNKDIIDKCLRDDPRLQARNTVTKAGPEIKEEKVSMKRLMVPEDPMRQLMADQRQRENQRQLDRTSERMAEKLARYETEIPMFKRCQALLENLKLGR